MKKRTSVYLRAARRVALSREDADTQYARRERYSLCCCGALELANATWLEEYDFEQIFRRNEASVHWYWWADPMRSMRDQQARVLALLFMHWMEVDP